MEIFVDNTGRQLLTGSDSVSPLGTLRLGENVTEPLSIWLLDRPATAGEALIPAAIPSPFTGLIFCGRPQADLEDEDALFTVTSFSAVGSGETLHYEGLLDLNTAPLIAALAGLKSLAIFVDVELQNNDATRNRRLLYQAPALVLRDIYRGTEPDPVSGDPVYPLPQNLVQPYPLITGLSGGGSTKLDGIITAGGVAPVVIATPNLADGKMWQLKAGTTATGPGVQRPADYHATTNTFAWHQVL